MKEKLIKVIDTFIIPHYPNIDDYRVVEEEKIWPSYVTFRPITIQGTMYHVAYFLIEGESYKGCEKLEKETLSLFEMLGPKENQKINVVCITT